MKAMSDLQPLQSNLLAQASVGTAIRHGFFSAVGGVSSGIYESLNVGIGSADNPDHVAENRSRVAAFFDLPSNRLHTPHQIHSPDVVVIRSSDGFNGGEKPKADGVVTALPGIAIGIVTADCGPVLFLDPEANNGGGIVGACHAGWGGAVKGVLEATVDAMVATGAQRNRIVVALGPSISVANYEVGPEFVDRFMEMKSTNSRFFSPPVPDRPQHRMFDLPAYSISRLHAAGVRAENLDVCTYPKANNYFSYRRTTHRVEADYGRQMSAISLGR
ncbi:MAG: peptidoglycan editing factor PgeF [Pseudomonadota bacterium]